MQTPKVSARGRRRLLPGGTVLRAAKGPIASRVPLGAYGPPFEALGLSAILSLPAANHKTCPPLFHTAVPKPTGRGRNRWSRQRRQLRPATPPHRLQGESSASYRLRLAATYDPARIRATG